jgi:hypothetical protein
MDATRREALAAIAGGTAAALLDPAAARAEGEPVSTTAGDVWSKFCRELEAVGQLVLAGSSEADPLDRAEGYRALTRLLRGGLEQFIEYDDPQRPRLFANSHETLKVIAENPDNLYRYARIEPGSEYRLRGTRGGSTWMSVNIHGGAFGSPSSHGTAGALTHKQMHFERDGRFEVAISRERRSGNWLELGPDAAYLLIRQTFSDPAKRDPSELVLERLGNSEPAPPLEPDALARGLEAAVRYVGNVTRIANGWVGRLRPDPNRFREQEPAGSHSFKDPEITFHQAYFELEPEQALVVDVVPPRCDYWMFVLHNVWLESLDYLTHRITLNHKTAQLAPDGSLRVVVAQRDPGVPNWLDTAGHRRGTLGLRWVGTSVIDVVPTTRVVAASEVRGLA